MRDFSPNRTRSIRRGIRHVVSARRPPGASSSPTAKKATVERAIAWLSSTCRSSRPSRAAVAAAAPNTRIWSRSGRPRCWARSTAATPGAATNSSHSPFRRSPTPPGASGELELDERILLADVFHQLDDAERALIYLRLVREMGGQETAEQLGMSEDRLRRSTRAALAKLRGELEHSAFPGTPQARARSGNGPAAEVGASDTLPRAAPANGVDENGRSDSPSTKAEYSGRILVRMPQTLHDELARAAKSERVSLNQFITNALSAAIGWHRPPHVGRRTPGWLPAAVVTNIVVVVLAGITAMIPLLVAPDQGL